MKNCDAQERWDDDGGAVPLNSEIPAAQYYSEINGPAFVGPIERSMLFSHLELANRHFVESEHRVTRQQNLIAKLRAKRQNISLAVEFLRDLQDSQAIHLASRDRIQQALARLEQLPAAI